MADTTPIAWCDSALNLEMGCDGCELWNPKAGVRHCYAGRETERRAGQPGWPKSFDKPELFLHRLPDALAWPDLTGTRRPLKPWLDGLPRLVFLDDEGDTFTESLPLDWLAPLLPDLAASPHQWLVLTKRPRRLAEFSQRHRLPPNLWPGTSVDTRANLTRLDDLRRVRGGGVRFLSAEPLLEHLGPLDLGGIHWVIAGGESGPNYRPMDPAWALAVRDACRRPKIPFFFKQSSGPRPETGTELQGRSYREMPRRALVALKGGCAPQFEDTGKRASRSGNSTPTTKESKPMAGTITLTLKALGSEPVLLRDGQEPGMRRVCFAKDAADPKKFRNYFVFYWTPDDVLWITDEEHTRLKQLAKGKRKPFAVQVNTIDPVPGTRPMLTNMDDAWGRKFAHDARVERWFLGGD
jgi:protein gp37